MNMNSYRKNFLLYLQQNNKSLNTIEAYDKDLKQFLNFIDINCKYSNVNEIKITDLDNFKNTLKNYQSKYGKNLADTTINRKIATLKTYFKFLRRNRVVEENLGEYLENVVVKQEKKDIYLTNEEIKKLFAVTRNGIYYCKDAEYRMKRDECMLYFYLHLGLRDEELRTLKLKNVSENGMVKVFGKGGKSRTLALNKEGLQLYKDYLYARDIKNLNNNDDDYVFLTTRNKAMKHNSVTQKWLRDLMEKTGFSSERIKEVSIHKLRHTFATELRKNGCAWEDISNLMGHSSTDVTKNTYVHLDENYLKNICNKINY